MSKKLPVGIRNNNPGNLRYLKDWGWPGITGKDERNFAIFETPEHGLAEFIRQLRRDQKRGLLSLEQLLPKYAPASDNNDTEAYIKKVSERTNIPRNRALNLNDPLEQMSVMKAFVLHENGRPHEGWDDEWYDDAVYRRAIDMAKPLNKSRTVIGAATGGAVIVAEAVQEVALEVAQKGAEVGQVVEPWLPGWGKWVLMLIGLAGIGLAIYARWTRTQGE